MESPRRSDGRRRFGTGIIAIASAIVGVLALAAFAVAGSATLGAAKAKVGSRSEMIAVNSKGVAVYELVPETTKHLLCTSSMCLHFWPPVKVGAKVTKASGVGGKLGVLKRAGFTQLTLNGHPLYTFAEDGGKRGIATGDGIKTFGGTWHVFREG
ncbi:MAG: hypothetical protein WAL63_15205 [Solirubrobacteraceae bacterium]